MSFLSSTDALNRKLHEMASVPEPSECACRFLLDMRADVNNLSSDGKTPLQTALACDKLSIAKILVDHGAVVTSQDDENIARALMKASVKMEGSKDVEQARQDFISSGLPSVWQRSFMVRRPNLYSPQVLLGNEFVYLHKLAGSFDQFKLTKPIALFLIGDEHGFWKNYGAVTEQFSPSWNEKYKEVLEHYTVVRLFIDKSWNDKYEEVLENNIIIQLFIDNQDRLVSMIKRVKDFFPHLSIMHLAFNGHGLKNRFDFGRSSLRLKDGPKMKEVFDLLDLMAWISFWGCKNAKAKKEDGGLVAEYSGFANGRVVLGSKHSLSDVILRVASSPDPRLPRFLIPTFEKKRCI